MAKNITTQNVNTSTIKKIYVLQGESGSGKSSTIKEIYRILSVKYNGCVVSVMPIQKFTPSEYDMTIVIEITVNSNVIKIGIGSSGDTKGHIKNSLSFFNSQNCEIIFCAERNNNIQGTVAQWVKQAGLSQQIVDPTPKNKTANYSAMKIYTAAKKIVAKAEKIM